MNETHGAAHGGGCCGGHGTAKAATGVKDPVCGMTVEQQDAVATSDYKGKTYYFCSEDCKVTFDDSPEDYAGKA